MAIGVGVEIGVAAVRAAVLEQQGTTLKLSGWADVPCDTSSPQALTQSLAHIRSSLRLRQGVVLGLPTNSVILVTVEPLIVNPRRAALAVQFELQQHLPFGVDQTVWNYQWLNGSARPIDHTPANHEGRPVVVAAMKRSRLEERLASCQRAGLSIQSVGVNPVAAINVWRQELGKDAPSSALFLNLGEQQAEWMIWTPSFLQVLPIAVAPDAGVSDVPLQSLTSSLEALKAATQQLPTPPASCWLLGSRANRPELEERLAASLQVYVTRFQLNRLLRMDTIQVESPERCAVAVGLALQALGRANVSVNLLAERQRSTRSVQIRRAAWAAGSLCAMIAVGAGVNGLLTIRQRQARLLTLLAQREHTYQTLRPEVHALLKRQERIERRSEQLEALVTQRMLLAELLGKVTVTMPDDLWLTRLELSKPGSLEGLLEGHARSFQSVTHFMDQLKSVLGLTTVKPLATNVATDPETGKDLVTFSIVIQRRSSLDVENTLE
jgi:Tfp pilus assembly protein PilN